MARQTWLYKNGMKVLLPRAVSSVGREDPDAGLPWKARMRKNLYNLECTEGSRFKIPDYSKRDLARVWNDNA